LLFDNCLTCAADCSHWSWWGDRWHERFEAGGN